MQDTFRPDILHYLCNWNPSQLSTTASALSADHPTPAKKFAAYDAYFAYFEPLVLAEVAADLATSLERAQATDAPRRCSSTRVVQRAHDGGWNIDIGPVRQGSPSLGLSESDVVVLNCAPDQGQVHSQAPLLSQNAVLAVVMRTLSKGHVRLFVTKLPGHSSVKVETTPFKPPEPPELELEEGEFEEEEPQASRKLQWVVLKLGTIITAKREHDALRTIKNSPLLEAILTTKGTTARTPSTLVRHDDVDRSQSVANESQQTLAYVDGICSFRGLNSSQKRAIATASTTSQGFTVIQGPPGTGKTRTIISLLNVLHVDQYQRYYNGLLSSLEGRTGAMYIQARQTSSIPSSSQSPLGGLLGTMANALKNTLSSVLDLSERGKSFRQDIWHGKDHREHQRMARRPRLLVCAPSNAAVDEIVSRLVSSKFVDGKGELYCPELARIGAGDKVSDASRPFTAEGQAEAFLSRMSGPGWSAAATRAAQFAFLANWQNMCNSLLVQLEHIPKDQTTRPRIVALHEQLERLYRDLRRLRIASAGNLEIQGSREARLRKLARTYVEDAQVVFSTFSGAGSAILTQKSDSSDQYSLFDTVVLDESAQATEPSTLIPLTLGALRCILVGDPQQLPATVFSSGSAGVAYGQSLLDRLCRAGSEVLLLDTQYRMHPAISSFPRRYFYGGRLLDHESVQDEHRAKPFHDDKLKPRLGPYVFMDIAHGFEVQDVDDRSICNPQEAELAALIYKYLKKSYPKDTLFGPKGRISGSSLGFGVVTPYKRQLQALRQSFDRIGVPTGDIEVDTVDAYQGREKDVVILSCVRAAVGRRGIGFVRDVRRMNVGLTRARSSLIVLGNANALMEGSQDWAELINDAQSRGCLIRVNNVQRALTLAERPPHVLENTSGSHVSPPTLPHTAVDSSFVNSNCEPEGALKNDSTVITQDRVIVETSSTVNERDDCKVSSDEKASVDPSSIGSLRSAAIFAGQDGPVIGLVKGEGSHAVSSETSFLNQGDSGSNILTTEKLGETTQPEVTDHLAVEHPEQTATAGSGHEQTAGEIGSSASGLEGQEQKPEHDESSLIESKGSLNFADFESLLKRHVASGGAVNLEAVVAAAIASGAKTGNGAGESNSLILNQPENSVSEQKESTESASKAVILPEHDDETSAVTQGGVTKTRQSEGRSDDDLHSSSTASKVRKRTNREELDIDYSISKEEHVRKRSTGSTNNQSKTAAHASNGGSTMQPSGWEMLFGNTGSSGVTRDESSPMNRTVPKSSSRGGKRARGRRRERGGHGSAADGDRRYMGPANMQGALGGRRWRGDLQGVDEYSDRTSWPGMLIQGGSTGIDPEGMKSVGPSGNGADSFVASGVDDMPLMTGNFRGRGRASKSYSGGANSAQRYHGVILRGDGGVLGAGGGDKSNFLSSSVPHVSNGQFGGPWTGTAVLDSTYALDSRHFVGSGVDALNSGANGVGLRGYGSGVSPVDGLRGHGGQYTGVGASINAPPSVNNSALGTVQPTVGMGQFNGYAGQQSGGRGMLMRPMEDSSAMRGPTAGIYPGAQHMVVGVAGPSVGGGIVPGMAPSVGNARFAMFGFPGGYDQTHGLVDGIGSGTAHILAVQQPLHRQPVQHQQHQVMDIGLGGGSQVGHGMMGGVGYEDGSGRIIPPQVYYHGAGTPGQQILHNGPPAVMLPGSDLAVRGPMERPRSGGYGGSAGRGIGRRGGSRGAGRRGGAPPRNVRGRG